MFVTGYMLACLIYVLFLHLLSFSACCCYQIGVFLRNESVLDVIEENLMGCSDGYLSFFGRNLCWQI